MYIKRINMKNRNSKGQFIKGHKHTEEALEKNRIWHIGNRRSEETKEKIRLATLGNTSHLGYNHSPEAIEKMRKKRKEYWETTPNRDKHIGKIIASSHVKPNNCELELLRLFNEVAPNEWDYVGDGQFILAGKNPDLMNINGKKQVAELFGDFYHRGEDTQER
ncbi:hypothetical protein LCGC14_2617300, partial [marine sediment metagenome]